MPGVGAAADLVVAKSNSKKSYFAHLLDSLAAIIERNHPPFPGVILRVIQMNDPIEPKRRLTRKQVGQLLRDHGYPIGNGTLNRICSPMQAKGPPIAGWWNARPLYDADAVLAWAEARIGDRPQSFTRDGSQRPSRRSAQAERNA